ncbi:MAG: PAS domain S-box protein, partial [Mariprofundaceae bacterium]
MKKGDVKIDSGLVQNQATLAVNASVDAIVCSDESGLIRLWNPAAAALFGYTEKEALGQSLTILMSKANKKAHAKGVKRLISTGKPKLAGKTVQVNALKRDGSTIPLELTLAASKSKNGWQFTAFFHDYRKRLQAEEQIIEGQARLDDAQRVGHMGNWEFDLIQDRVLFSDETYRIFGISGDFKGSYKAYYRLIHPDDRLLVREANQKVVDSGSFSDVQYRIVRPDGSVRHIQSNGECQRDESGTLVRIFGSVVDITERKQAAERLQRREKQLEILAESGRVLNESLNEQQIKSRFVQCACDLVACESGAMGTYRDEEMVFTEYYKAGEFMPVNFSFSSGFGVPGHVLSTRKYYLSDNAELDEHVVPEIQQELGFMKLVDLPILDSKGELLGCFELHDRYDGEGFDDQDVQMLQSLGSIVSGALVNARLLEDLAHNLQERKDAEVERKILLHDSSERIKELRCIYAITESTRTKNELSTVFQDVVGLIPPGWQHSEITRAKIVYQEEEYVSEPFIESRWKQSGNIVLNGEVMGVVEVYYLKECPELDEGPFLKEERELLDGICEAVSQGIDMRLSEEAVQTNEERIRLLLDSTAEAIYGLDLDGNCTFANRACVTMSGYEHVDELIGKNMHKLIHHSRNDGSHYPVETCQIFKAFKEGKGAHVDNEVLWRKDGTSFLSEYFSYPIKKDKEVIGAVVTFTDITERKQAEEQLHMLSSSVEQASEAILITDLKGDIRYINPAFTRLTGYSEEEATGKNPKILNSGSQNDAFYREMWGVINQGNAWQGRVVDRKKNGSFYP